MNRNFTILIFSLTLLLNNITAQKINYGLDAGYGTYKMTEIKHFLDNIMNSNELQPHRVSNFPGYLFFRSYLGIEYQHLNLGFAYTLMSTGSRYSIYDYSGDYRFDTQIIGNSSGLFAELPVMSFNRFKFIIAAESGMILNKLKLSESFQLTDIYIQQDNYNFRSINIFVKPYFKLEYEIWKKISANVLIGYHKDIIRSKMHLEGDILSKTDFTANWDGIRTSIGLSYRFD